MSSTSVTNFDSNPKNLIQRVLNMLNSEVDSSYPKSESIECLIDEKQEVSNFSSLDAEYLKYSAHNNENFLRILTSYLANPTKTHSKYMKSKLEEVKMIPHEHFFVKKSKNESKDTYIFSEHTIDEMLSLYSGRTPSMTTKTFSEIKPSVISKTFLYLHEKQVKKDLENYDKDEICLAIRKPIGRTFALDYKIKSKVYVRINDYIDYLKSVVEWGASNNLPVYVQRDELVKSLILTPSKSSFDVNFYTDSSQIYRHPMESNMENKFVSIESIILIITSANFNQNSNYHEMEAMGEMGEMEAMEAMGEMEERKRNEKFVNLHHLIQKLEHMDDEVKHHKHMISYSDFSDYFNEEKTVREEMISSIHDYGYLAETDHENAVSRFHESKRHIDDVDEQDNYWNMELSMKFVRDKVSKLQNSRFKNNRFESLFEETSGIFNQDKYSHYSRKTINHLLSGGSISEIDIKSRYVPIMKFKETLNDMISSLDNQDLNSFVNHCNVAIDLMYELNNQDELNKYMLYLEDKNSEFTRKMINLTSESIVTLNYISKNQDDNVTKNMLMNVVESLSRFRNKKLLLLK